MNYKFEQLTVWNLALELSDHIYEIANSLPEVEKFNLNSQICRASTSISLNIAEGSTSQSNAEQKRFIGYAIRSLIEVIACLRLIERRSYMISDQLKDQSEAACNKLFIKLQAFKNALK